MKSQQGAHDICMFSLQVSKTSEMVLWGVSASALTFWGLQLDNDLAIHTTTNGHSNLRKNAYLVCLHITVSSD